METPAGAFSSMVLVVGKPLSSGVLLPPFPLQRCHNEQQLLHTEVPLPEKKSCEGSYSLHYTAVTTAVIYFSRKIIVT